MITLFLYPVLFSLPNNNPFGLKVDTFLKLTGVEYQAKHIAAALPYRWRYDRLRQQ